MSERHLLKSAGDVKALAERLSRCPEVAKFDKGDEVEGWTLAASFSDLEGSFREFLDDQLPRLIMAGDPTDMVDVLLDVGEELRHILYHIKDPRFYRYISEGGS